MFGLSTMQDALSTIHTDWRGVIEEHLAPYIEHISTVCNDTSTRILPEKVDIFNAFAHFPRKDLKVVIIGQDPYHTLAKNGVPLANGLCFSVNAQCGKCPPSLRTIFKELLHEYPNHEHQRTDTDLVDWAKQGVLLLNCALTVREGNAGSHMKAWKPFTYDLMKHITSNSRHVVYILWGEFAKSFGSMVDKDNNLVLECRHPSGLAASKGPFVGNNHFTLANEYLVHHGKTAITWV